MPLNIADGSIDSLTLKSVPEKFLIFYSSIVDGRLWCGDCRDVEKLIDQTFKPEVSPQALIIYVGDKPQWKTPDNIYRGEPWKLTDIPTIVKLRNGEEEGRLVLNEIENHLSEFVKD